MRRSIRSAIRISQSVVNNNNNTVVLIYYTCKKNKATLLIIIIITGGRLTDGFLRGHTQRSAGSWYSFIRNARDRETRWNNSRNRSHNKSDPLASFIYESTFIGVVSPVNIDFDWRKWQYKLSAHRFAWECLKCNNFDIYEISRNF